MLVYLDVCYDLFNVRAHFFFIKHDIYCINGLIITFNFYKISTNTTLIHYNIHYKIYDQFSLILVLYLIH